jgi:hypothetical protein
MGDVVRMRGNLGLLAGVAALSACAGLDKSGLETYDEIRAAILVSTDPTTGIVTASTEPAAKEEVEISDFPTGPLDASGSGSGSLGTDRDREKAFVLAERAAGGATQVYVVHRRVYPIPETSLQAKPWTETDPDRTGFIGETWREVPFELVEFRYECTGSRVICTRYATDRLKLSADDVRALLRQNKDSIRVSFHDYRTVSWRLDTDELTAILDALGATEDFR